MSAGQASIVSRRWPACSRPGTTSRIAPTASARGTRSVRRLMSAAHLPRKKRGCWSASAFPLACDKKGNSAIPRLKIEGTPAELGWCVAAITIIGVADRAFQALNPRSAPRAFSARRHPLSPFACPRARSASAPKASIVSGSRREPRSVHGYMAPTAGSPRVPKARCAEHSRRRPSLGRSGWSASSDAVRVLPLAAQGRSAMAGSACQVATPRAPPTALKDFGADSPGRTHPSPAILIGEPRSDCCPPARRSSVVPRSNRSRADHIERVHHAHTARTVTRSG
jgi:hypothetical protein